MTTSTPKTLKAALAEINDLHVQLHQFKDRAEKHYNTYNDERSTRVAAQTERDETHAQFAELKQRLLNAETELSRLRGYLARVHEDDVVRDGMVEIEDVQGKRQVPRRQLPMTSAYPVDVYSDMANGLNAPYGREKKRTHWTSY